MRGLEQDRGKWDGERGMLKEEVRRLRVEVNALRAEKGIPGVELRRQSIAQQTPDLARIAQASVQLRPPKDCPICPDPDPDCPCQQPQSRKSPLQTLTSAAQTVEEHNESCGLCRSSEECLCRIVEANQQESPQAGCGLCNTANFCACSVTSVSTSAPAAALPLRPRLLSSTVPRSIWTIDTPAIARPPIEAVCSGDPNNCDACRDDDFGMSPSYLM